jgi:membrane fusion protein (multidrug efflux system)
MLTPEKPSPNKAVPSPEMHPAASAVPVKPHSKRRLITWTVTGLLVVVVAAAGTPWLLRVLSTVSTDDAYVNGHVTFVAPRVAGQVARVLVDDNNRVRKGDLLVQLDKEPFQVQLDIAQAFVISAQADLAAAQAEIRATAGKARSMRYNLERSIEDVHNQVALLNLRVASWQSQKASLSRAQADYDRAKPLLQSGAMSKEEFDLRKEAILVAQARMEEALQSLNQVRVALGLAPKAEGDANLAEVPDNLDQTFSSVKQAQSSLIQVISELGVTQSFNLSPKQMVAEFYKRDPSGDLDRIYGQLFKDAPAVKQAEAKLAQAQRNLDQTKLNLHYCDVFAEIDGVITRRNVNPGNNIVVGQSLMAIRSLTEIWIDANFKETQLADMRIGQSVDLDVDMYGSRQRFKGRISGFTMGTGSTLALLPAENATGNFVKVVQRLPVRIEVMDYDPEKLPLFIGLSVTPRVLIKEPATGPDAGKFLQPNFITPRTGQ